MTYRPDCVHDFYVADDEDDAYSHNVYPYRDRHWDNWISPLVVLIRVFSCTILAIFALHVLFVVVGANHGSLFVAVDDNLAQTFVLGLADVITPGSAVLGVVLNYILATVIYAVITQLVIKALRRR